MADAFVLIDNENCASKNQRLICYISEYIERLKALTSANPIASDQCVIDANYWIVCGYSYFLLLKHGKRLRGRRALIYDPDHRHLELTHAEDDPLVEYCDNLDELKKHPALESSHCFVVGSEELLNELPFKNIWITQVDIDSPLPKFKFSPKPPEGYCWSLNLSSTWHEDLEVDVEAYRKLKHEASLNEARRIRGEIKKKYGSEYPRIENSTPIKYRNFHLIPTRSPQST